MPCSGVRSPQRLERGDDVLLHHQQQVDTFMINTGKSR